MKTTADDVLSPTIIIIVDNTPHSIDTLPPMITATEPAANNSTVGNIVPIIVDASDDFSLSVIRPSIDGTIRSATDMSPLSDSGNTR